MGVKITSNFYDYYDSSCTDKNGMEYKRIRPETSRTEELKFLRNMYIPTIRLEQVSNMDRSVSKVVVYTDPKKHENSGKKVMGIGEANQLYRNHLACEYIDGDVECIKYVQVGQRRFFIRGKKKEEYSLEVVYDSIEEVDKGYSPNIHLPIFSIDYISKDGVTLACDFNRVQRLDILGMERVITKEEVATEVEEALLKYSKFYY